MALIPAIASFFGVSTDELFGFDLLDQEQKVMEICRAAADIRGEDPAGAEAMLRRGLKQYPGNEIILNNLLYTMRAPERNEEVVTLCKSILEITRLDDVKYDVLRILAETYHDMGEQALVKPTLERIPEIYFSKLELDAKLLEGEEALAAAGAQAGLSRGDLMEMLAVLSQRKRAAGETAEAERYAALARGVYALFDGSVLGYSDTEHKWLADEVWPRLG